MAPENSPVDGDHRPRRRDLRRLGYVATGYPYVSHTFILNEVAALRRLGFSVETFSVRREPDTHLRSAAERDAQRTTYALRPPRILDYVVAHGRALRTGRYWGTLRRALALGRASRRSVWRSVAHFAQAIVLWDRCQRARVSHIHAHFANVASDLAMLATTLAGPGHTWSFTMHGPTEFYAVRAYNLSEKIGAASLVVCISDFARSQMMAQSSPDEWSKLRVVHCGVNLDEFDAADTGSAEQSIRIACVGRLVPEKGQTLLIEAVTHLCKRGIGAELILAGDGPDRQRLEEQVARLQLTTRVRFLGSISPSEVRTLLRESDVLCLPSFAEGVPVSIMEAMATERPVVTTAVMGIPELVEDGVSGRLVRPGSIDDLVDALSDLAVDPGLRAELGAAGRRRVADDFAIDDCAQQLATLIDRATAATE